jgi:hypothetical protein
MAMHQPSTRVIGWEGDDDIATGISGVCITSDWVVKVKRCSSSASTARCDDPLSRILAIEIIIWEKRQYLRNRDRANG